MDPERNCLIGRSGDNMSERCLGELSRPLASVRMIFRGSSSDHHSRNYESSVPFKDLETRFGDCVGTANGKNLMTFPSRNRNGQKDRISPVLVRLQFRVIGDHPALLVVGPSVYKKSQGVSNVS